MKNKLDWFDDNWNWNVRPIQVLYELLLSPTYRWPRKVKEVCSYKWCVEFPRCPRCGISMEREYQRFCDRCSQRLNWSGFDDVEVRYIGWDGVEDDDRPEAQCVRGKAEGLCGNTGVKGLPVAFERAGIAAVPLKTRASRHHRQRNQCGGMGKRVGVIGEIQHTIAGDFLTLLRIFHKNIAGDLGIFPAGGISGSGHHFGHLLRGNRLFGKAADAAPGLDAFQCFHNCFLLTAVCWI